VPRRKKKRIQHYPTIPGNTHQASVTTMRGLTLKQNKDLEARTQASLQHERTGNQVCSQHPFQIQVHMGDTHVNTSVHNISPWMPGTYKEIHSVDQKGLTLCRRLLTTSPPHSRTHTLIFLTSIGEEIASISFLYANFKVKKKTTKPTSQNQKSL
jgi:hypothetical protein